MDTLFSTFYSLNTCMYVMYTFMYVQLTSETVKIKSSITSRFWFWFFNYYLPHKTDWALEVRQSRNDRQLSPDAQQA